MIVSLVGTSLRGPALLGLGNRAHRVWFEPRQIVVEQSLEPAYEPGTLVLIYPASGTFDKPLPAFKFSKALELWALPFDLDLGRLNDQGLANLPLKADNIKLQ
jgi:hypothetical protein